MTKRKAASAPAPAATPAKPRRLPFQERPCPKDPDGQHLFLDQVEGAGRIRQAFISCRHCGGRVNTHTVEV